MPEDPATPPAPAAPVVDPPVGTAVTPETPAGQEPEVHPDLRRARDEAGRYRTELRTAQAQLKAIEDAKLSDQEKLTKRLGELEQDAAAARTEAREARIEALAAKAGAVDPEAVVALVVRAGIPEGKSIEDAVSDLLKARPWLAGTPAAAPGQAPVRQGSPTNPARSGTNPAVFTQSQLSDRAFYAANRDAIFLAVKEGRIVDG